MTSHCGLRPLQTARNALTGNMEVTSHGAERKAVVVDRQVANRGACVEDVGA